MNVTSKSQWALVAATLGVVSLSSVSSAIAANGTWAGTTDANWVVDGNWIEGLAPGAIGTTNNTDTAFFAAATSYAPVADAGRNIMNITFSSATAYTLSGGPLVLTSGGTILATATQVNTTISSALQVAGENGTYSITTNTPGTNRVTTLAGAISGSSTGTNVSTLTLSGTSGAANLVNGVISDGTGGGKLALVKSDAGLWVMSAATSTYTGGTTINGGILRQAASGNSSATIGTGTLTFTGGQYRLQSSSASTLNNAIVVTDAASTGTVSFRANGTFAPTALTGSGTLFLTADAAQTITPNTSFFDFAGVVDTTGTAFFRLGSALVKTSLQNARLNIAAGTAEATQSGTSTTSTFDIGALSGGGSLGGSGAGAGSIVYRIGNRAENTTFSGTIVDGGSKTTINKVGASSTLSLTGANSYTGTTTITAGTLNINGINALGGGVYGNFNGTGLAFNGGTLQYAEVLTSSGDVSTQAGGVAKNVTFTQTANIDTAGNTVTYANTVGNGGAGGLNKKGDGTLILTAANYLGGTTVTKGTLQLSTAASAPALSNAAGTDIQNGQLVIDYTGGTTPADTIRGLLQTSYNDVVTPGVMDSGQIRSSTSTASRGLGYKDNGTNLVTVRATLYGDADLNGSVTIDDFNALAVNFGASSGKVWVDGDFNYNGGVTIDDFNLLAVNFGNTLPAADRAETMMSLYAFAVANNDGPQFYALTGVPEPTSLGLLAAGAVMGLRRRRRAC